MITASYRDAITIFGDDYDTADGTCIRDYIHVLDLAQALILALRSLENRSREYNLGNGLGFRVKEVMETARQVTGHPIQTRVGPRRPGDPPILNADSAKIRQELGWEPRFPDLYDIIESAWQWHSRHPHGYQD